MGDIGLGPRWVPQTWWGWVGALMLGPGQEGEGRS